MGGKRARLRLSTGQAGLAVACVALAACTTVSGRGSAAPTTPSSSPAPSTSTSQATGDCPSSYAQPDPNRPRVRLTFAIDAAMTTVRGTEHIAFTPDRPITELVFRLTANTAPTVAEGNKIVVTSAKADHGGGAFRITRAGAAESTQGGLLHIPFGASIPAGTTVTADITFTVTLAAESFDRFGRVTSGGAQYAWFASAQPLLAWERGYGWHTEDLIKFVAESATSEAMNTDLTVTAPAADTVIMSGDPTTPTSDGDTKSWHATIAAARDVSVAVGPFSVTDTTVGSVRLRVGAYTSQIRDDLVPEFRRAITELERRFGPYPFPSLSVARVPAQGGGIEYPSSILMLDGSRLVAVHETAHQWFYAMVGDSQSLHPWLDEGFATYAEQLVDGNLDQQVPVDYPGTVDRSVESYGSDMDTYYLVTYYKGAAALTAARDAAGPARWDAAVRCYVAANAWRIANPSDFQAAISKFPKAVAILRRAGALP